MTKKLLAVLLVGCLLAALPFTFTACDGEGGGGTPSEGQLPTFEVGDTWVWSYTMYGTTYTLTEEVIGEERAEGRDCYVLDMSFDPTLTFSQEGGESTITAMTYWGDKATAFSEVKQEMVGDYNGESFTLTYVYSYDPWASLFPLELGKEVETEQTATQYMGETQAGEPTVTTIKYRVDSRETVTVSAGTFDCFKIIIYDGEGNVTQIAWWTDEVKSMVKSEDASGKTLMELLSYSVS
jgi:hypothetical protein